MDGGLRSCPPAQVAALDQPISAQTKTEILAAAVALWRAISGVAQCDEGGDEIYHLQSGITKELVAQRKKAASAAMPILDVPHPAATHDAQAVAVLSRATDSDTAVEMNSASVFISKGTTYANTAFVQTTDDVILNTSNIVWEQFASFSDILAGNGLSKVGNTSQCKCG